MGMETVREEILGSAKAETAVIISEARREASRIQRDAEKKAEEFRERIEAETKKAIDNIKRQETASAELESKKAVLEAKKEIIDAAFEEARKRLHEMDEKKREHYLKKIIEKTAKDIDVGHIYCSKKDSKLLKVKCEPIDISGGIIAENKEKTIRVDYSYETLLDSIKETQMQHINKILFG